MREQEIWATGFEELTDGNRNPKNPPLVEPNGFREDLERTIKLEGSECCCSVCDERQCTDPQRAEREEQKGTIFTLSRSLLVYPCSARAYGVRTERQQNRFVDELDFQLVSQNFF